MFHQVGIKAIGIENILILNDERDDTPTDLILGNLQAKHLLFWKG